LVISNHNSFLVVFQAFPYTCVLFEKYIYIVALEMVNPWNQHCANILSFPIEMRFRLCKHQTPQQICPQGTAYHGESTVQKGLTRRGGDKCGGLFDHLLYLRTDAGGCKVK